MYVLYNSINMYVRKWFFGLFMNDKNSQNGYTKALLGVTPEIV